MNHEIQYNITVSEIMDNFKLSIKDISNIFKIPYRTVQNWAGGVATPPPYIPNMMFDILVIDNMLECDKKELEYYDNVLDRASNLLHDGRIKEDISLIDNS